jgi:alkylation response protein AidB-like acyl-CoA dehydrogenase
MLRESVSRFANETIKPRVRAMDESSTLDTEVLKGCFDQGLMGIETATEMSGAGLSFTSACIVIEELAKVDPAVSVVVDVQNTLVGTLLRTYGTAAQQTKYLTRLATDTVGSFCLSEWGSGSDAFAMKTTAVKKGDKYVINGTKAWITNAKEAGIFIVFANADPSKGYKGITAFIVEKGTPGLIVGKKEDKLGIRASSTCEVRFEDMEVSEASILGEFGKGYKLAIEVLNEGRIGIGAQMLGLAAGALESTLPYLAQRRQFGQPIAAFQGMQFNYAQCAMEIEAARLLVYNAARLKDSAQPFIQEASMAKLYASLVAEKVSSQCISMLGGVGFTKEFPAEKYFRDSKIGQIYEGTTNIQLVTIAKHIMDKYK